MTNTRTTKRCLSIMTALSVSWVLSCATTEPAQSTPPQSPAPVPVVYGEIPWAKLFNAAFVKDLDGKAVKVVAQWIGPAQSMMHMTAGFEPWKSMMEVGIAPVGATKTAMGGQWEGQQWAVYISKDKSDAAFAFKEGQKVRLFVQAKGYISDLQNCQTLLIDRIESAE